MNTCRWCYNGALEEGRNDGVGFDLSRYICLLYIAMTKTGMVAARAKERKKAKNFNLGSCYTLNPI